MDEQIGMTRDSAATSQPLRPPPHDIIRPNSSCSNGVIELRNPGTFSEDSHSPQSAAGQKRKATSAASYGDARRERSKTTRACDTCKNKKSKCSGTQPCERCVKLGLSCDYKSTYMRGLPPSPAQVSVNFPRELDPGAILRNVRGNSHVDAGVRSLPTNDSSLVYLRDPEAEERSYAISSRNSPERGATDFEGQYLGPSSGLTFLNRAWRRLNQDHVPTVSLDIQSESPHDTSTFNYGDTPFSEHPETNISLPSLSRAVELVSLYFDYAVVTYRFLHRTTTQQWLVELYDEDISMLDKASQSMIVKSTILFMIFAIVTLHEEQHTERQSQASASPKSEHWYAVAKKMMSKHKGPPRLEMIQARLVQCLYLLASSRANQCWYTFGTTMQMLMALGLHRKRPSGKPKASGMYILSECQKRVFWSAYTMDRYLSVMLGRPRIFHDEEIDQALPDEINDEDMTPDGPKIMDSKADCVLTASIFHFRLSCLVGKISYQVYTIRKITEGSRLEAAERLAAELEAWHSSLPPIFSSVRSSSLIAPLRRQSNVLHIAYAHSVMHANRPFLLSNFSNFNKQPPISKENVAVHVGKCVDAAKLIVEIVNGISDNAPLSQAFWFTHYACFCAVIVLYIYTIQQHRLHHPNDRDKRTHIRASNVPNNLLQLAEDCQRQLGEATRKNSPSRRYAIILEELRQEVYRQIGSPLEDSVARSNMASDPSAPSSQTEAVHAPDANNSFRGGFADPNSHHYSGNIQDLELAPESDAAYQQLQFELQQKLFDQWDLISWQQMDSWAYSNMQEPSADAY